MWNQDLLEFVRPVGDIGLAAPLSVCAYRSSRATSSGSGC